MQTGVCFLEPNGESEVEVRPWDEMSGGDRGAPGGSQAPNNRETLTQARYKLSPNTEVVPSFHTRTHVYLH